MSTLVTTWAVLAEKVQPHGGLEGAVVHPVPLFHRCQVCATDPPKHWRPVGVPQKL